MQPGAEYFISRFLKMSYRNDADAVLTAACTYQICLALMTRASTTNLLDGIPSQQRAEGVRCLTRSAACSLVLNLSKINLDQ
jgi:hypothetical protein